MRYPLAAVVASTILALVAPPAQAAQSRKKSIWGPVQVQGVSQFPIYRDLGVGIYQSRLGWHQIAPTRPSRPTDPRDPVYRWPPEVDYAIREAQRYGIEVSLMITRAPRWANGGRPPRWAPKRSKDFADFAEAAARRYPAVRHWMIWGEPSRRNNFMPLAFTRRSRLTRAQRRGPQIYARLLDAAYVRIKRVNERNLVIGGNTFTTGDIPVKSYIKALRVKGRPPRMDLYGHNPFTIRRPNLRRPPLGHGFADFSDLDTLARWVDRYLTVGGRSRRPLRFFISEFVLPTDHPNREFAFYVSRRIQASWLSAALRITRRWPRIYTFGWLGLYDDPPRRRGDEVNRGLLDIRGRKKPSYNAYKRG